MTPKAIKKNIFFNLLFSWGDEMSRTRNSIKNLVTALVGQALGFIISFVARIFFIRVLGKEYLGLNGLFTNILSILSLAELGIGEAIIFSLYKPLADDDKEKCTMLMQLYKKVYTIIGLVILLVGISLTPFLPLIIKNMPDIPYISFIYILFVVNTSVSYFFSYKRNLIIADQKRYIVTFVRYAVHFVFTFLEIIYLLIWRDYIGYLVIMILATIVDNFIVSMIANRIYPYLNTKNKVPLDDESKDSIIKNTKALMIHKVGGVVVNSTDNILLSSIVSLNSVALYSNYFYITNALNSISQHVFNSVVAGVGNMFVVDSKEKKYRIFKDVLFLDFWMYCFIAVCLLSLFNPFIELCFGSEYLFSFDIVCIIVINFYAYGMRKSSVTFRQASGLFYKDRWKSVFEATINLVSSIVFAYYLGTFGVFLGTLVSFVCVSVWVEPLVLYKYGFEVKLREYFKVYLKYLLITVICSVGTYYICSFINVGPILSFIIKIIICLIIPNAVIILLFRKSDEFQYLSNILKKFLGKIFHKKVKYAK